MICICFLQTGKRLCWYEDILNNYEFATTRLKNRSKIARTIHKAVKTVAELCMSNAAKEIKTNNGVSNTTIFETSVSNDGAWQRRGLALMNGNIAMIFLETGRIIDTEPISRYCQKCALNYKFKAADPLQYETFLSRHENSCMANHKGSATVMEIIGMKRIFRHSIEKRGLRYVKFLGDGDSKSFPAVEDIYDGIKVEKL